MKSFIDARRAPVARIMSLRALAAAAFGAVLALTSSAFAAWNDGGPPPKLIVQITVDQLRGDLPGRYLDRMGEGGFRYLMQHGIWYADAHHAHANTETVVGHTTLATGADPATHGMVANVWLDRKTGKLAYDIQDDRYRILTPGAGVDKAHEFDPAQKLATTDGRSPAAILVSTFSDELAIRYARRSKIFGVSVKDRGAVPLAGHAGKAFWFSKTSGDFVTSTFYYDRYPTWVNEWNQKKLAASYSGKSWELLYDRSTYMFGAADDMPWETDYQGYGRVFPHPFGKAGDKDFTTRLTISPVGDDLTLDFAETLIDREELGRHDVPDYLSISFSSTDYVGHIFGPSSLESEDNLLRLDRTLTALLAYVDKRVGLANTLIVLSADHGAPEVPGYLNTLGIAARFLRPEQWDTQPGIAALKKKFGIGKELIRMYEHPYLYLNEEVIRERGLNQAEVENAVAAELMKLDGIRLAISSTALRENNLPSTPRVDAVLRNFNPQRSGDIFVVFESDSFLRTADGLPAASSHGSPWRYDTYVPVVFAGGSVKPRRVYREIETVDLASTLSAVVGANPPSGARGAPLVEVLENR